MIYTNFEPPFKKKIIHPSKNNYFLYNLNINDN